MQPDLLNPYGPRMTAHMAFFGIDPTDRIYTAARAQTGGWCTFCALHSVSNPRPRCDLEQARAKELEAEGYETSVCFRCKCAHPKMFSKDLLCLRCHRLQEERDAKVVRQPSRSTGQRGRIADGLGCTERVPGWMVDWDGNPNA